MAGSGEEDELACSLGSWPNDWPPNTLPLKCQGFEGQGKVRSLGLGLDSLVFILFSFMFN